MRKEVQREHQLSLFESSEPPPPMNEVEVAIAQFERSPDMSPEEYKRWIKQLIHNSLKSME